MTAADLPPEALATARAKRDRGHAAQDDADLARIEYWEYLQRLLLDDDGHPRRGVRRQLERALGLDYSTLRYIERQDCAHLRRQLADRQARRADGGTQPPGAP